MMTHPTHDLCIIGPVSKDRIWHGDHLAHTAAGGVPTYAGVCASTLGAKVHIISTWAEEDNALFLPMFAGHHLLVTNQPKELTTTFDLRYQDPQHAERAMTCTALAPPPDMHALTDVETRLLYLAPLMPSDMDPHFVEHAAKVAPVALDAQGFVRTLDGEHVVPCSWPDLEQALPYIRFLKVSAEEAALLTGQTHYAHAAQQLLDLGANEVIVTRDDCGAYICNAHRAFDISAYTPSTIVDTTGCGDTFFAAYLFHRLRSSHLEDAGRFAAAVAAMKIQHWGPSQTSWQDVLSFQDSNENVR